MGAEQTGQSAEYWRVLGPEVNELRTVPSNQANIVGQYRSHYEKEDEDELVRSMDTTGMRNPILLCEMSPAQAKEYIDYADRVWQDGVRIEDLVANQEGNYYIVVAGHRRTISARRIAIENGVPEEDLGIQAFVTTDKSILELLRLQGSENVYRLPLPQDKARLIQQMYLFGVEHDMYRSVAEFVDDSPYSEHETRAALRYVQLPEELKEFVEGGFLSYSAAVAMYPLLDAAYKHHEFKNVPTSEIMHKREETVMAIARYLVTTIPRLSADFVSKFVKQRCQELTYGQPELVLCDPNEDKNSSRSQPSVALLLRQTQIIESLVNVLNNNGTLKGWSLGHPVLGRELLLDTMAYGVANMRRIRSELGGGADTSEPRLATLDEYIEEAQITFDALSAAAER